MTAGPARVVSLVARHRKGVVNTEFDVRPDDIGRVILVGGSSLMGFVTAEARALCPTAEILQSEAFTAVVDGLALATHH